MRILLLDSIRSLHNVGVLFRTCDGAGFERIILTGYTPTPPRREMSKTALGAEKTVAWEYYTDPVEAVRVLHEQGYRVYAVEDTPESVSYRILRTETHSDICLIVGNETEGVSSALLSVVDATVEIPMRGQKVSLNVAIAAAVCMYELGED